MKKSLQLVIAVFVICLFSGSAFAVPVVFNNTIPAGTAFFDSTVTGVGGGTVTTDTLSGLASGSSWSRTDYTITSTSGSSRSIDTNYGTLTGEAIGINPTSPAATSGLTFTFESPVNAFGLEIGDWATCCYPSGLYIGFDGGATQLVAMANAYTDNPGYTLGVLGDYESFYNNFVGAIDDTATFSTVTFYGDGFGEYLVAGGTIRYGTVAQGSIPGTNPVPEPSTIILLGAGLAGLGIVRRKQMKK